MFEAYLEEEALAKAGVHVSKAAEGRLEAMGLLCGRAYKWDGKTYVVVTDCITAENEATSVEVRFARDSFPDVAQGINAARKKGLFIVGWYHSHPSYGCFLSSQDVETQKRFFSEDFNIALVIDPLRKEKQVFKLAEGKEDGNGYGPASYAVVRKKA